MKWEVVICRIVLMNRFTASRFHQSFHCKNNHFLQITRVLGPCVLSLELGFERNQILQNQNYVSNDLKKKKNYLNIIQYEDTTKVSKRRPHIKILFFFLFYLTPRYLLKVLFINIFNIYRYYNILQLFTIFCYKCYYNFIYSNVLNLLYFLFFQEKPVLIHYFLHNLLLLTVLHMECMASQFLFVIQIL